MLTTATGQTGIIRIAIRPPAPGQCAARAVAVTVGPNPPPRRRRRGLLRLWPTHCNLRRHHRQG